MDDLQFRRNLYAAPKEITPEMAEAINESESRKAFAQDLQKFDQKILTAMEVEVPENLANKLLLKQSIHSHQQQRRKTRVHLAMAASVAFALGISYNLLSTTTPVGAQQSLSAHAIEHVHHEAHYFSNNSTNRVTLASLNNQMGEQNAKFTNEIGQLMAAGYCTFDGVRALHLVYQGEHDSVAVLFIPKSESLSFDEQFNKDGLKAISKEYGNSRVIIVGQESEVLEPWQEKISDYVEWSI